MSRTPRTRWRFGATRSKKQIRAELDEEIAFHLEQRARQLEQRGMASAEARTEALRRFGDRQRTTQVCCEADQRRERAMERSEIWSETLQDLRLGVRQLRRRPGFAAITMLTLAVGIGATTTVFSTADHVLLRPLPYADQGRVVTVWEKDLRTGARRRVSPGNFISWQRRAQSFVAMGLAEPWGSDVQRNDGPPQELPAWRVSEGFLAALGVAPMLGQALPAEEFAGLVKAPPGVLQMHEGTGKAVLLSEDLWRTQYGADPDLIGTTLQIDDVARTVVGVLPHAVAYPERRPLWLPKKFTDTELQARTASFMQVVARLEPGVSLAQAQAEMDRIAADLAVDFPATNHDTGVLLVPLEDEVLGGVRPALLLLLGAVAFVLLVACSNVASLMLAHSAGRRRELSVRAAMGAGRARLLRQLITESLVLGVLGGSLGLALAALATRAVVVLGSASLPRVETIALGGRVLAFAVVTSLFAGFVAGMLPALRFSRCEGGGGAQER